MGINRKIKMLFENITGTRIYRNLPRGVDVFYDINVCLPNFHPEIVFDVGANTGQSAQRYLSEFPGSKIYCFEPVASTYRMLKSNMRVHSNVLTYMMAFGAAEGKGRMALEGSSDMFFLINSKTEVPVNGNLLVDEVAMETLDGFCLEHCIMHIDYLKIDTEGGDMDVLRGAQKSIGAAGS